MISGDVMQRALSIAPARSQLASLATRQSPEEYTNPGDVTDSAQNIWFQTEAGDYATVRQACLDNGGEIATIHSAAENQAADETCNSDSVSVYSDMNRHIGLIRDSPGIPWHW